MMGRSAGRPGPPQLRRKKRDQVSDASLRANVLRAGTSRAPAPKFVAPCEQSRILQCREDKRGGLGALLWIGARRRSLP